MRSARFHPLIVAAAATVAPLPASAQRPVPARVREFRNAMDTFIRETLDSLAVPGVTVTVVRAGEPVYIAALGLADVPAKRRMTTRTPVYIASNTKSFVALTAALLDTLGSIDLARSITDYLPDAGFAPELRPDSITIEHLLTHTSGLSNDPIVVRTAYTGDYTQDDLLRLLAISVARDGAPLGTFGYTNLGYNIAGIVMEHATGTDWRELLRRHVLVPLGMFATYATVPPLATPPAEGYRLTGNGIEAVYLAKVHQTMHAAGGIYSTAEDLARWIEAQLAGGVVDGEQRIPPGVIDRTQRIHAVTEGRSGPFGRAGYGLGWIIGSYGEEPLIYHFGTFPGANSMISMMPQHDMAVAVFANEEVLGIRVAALISMFAYDWWTGHPEGTEIRRGLRASLPQLVAEARARAEPAPARLDGDRAEAYVGTYSSESYGTLRVMRAGASGLELRFGEMRGAVLALDEPNAFAVELIPGRPETFRFNLEDGRAISVAYEDFTVFRREGQR